MLGRTLIRSRTQKPSRFDGRSDFETVPAHVISGWRDPSDKSADSELSPRLRKSKISNQLLHCCGCGDTGNFSNLRATRRRPLDLESLRWGHPDDIKLIPGERHSNISAAECQDKSGLKDYPFRSQQRLWIVQPLALGRA